MFFFFQLLLAAALITASSVLFCGCCKKNHRSRRVTRNRPIITNRPKVSPFSNPVQSKPYHHHCQPSNANGIDSKKPDEDDRQLDALSGEKGAEPRTAMRSLIDIDPEADVQGPRSMPLDEKAQRIKAENLKKDPKDMNPYPTIEQMLSDREKDS